MSREAFLEFEMSSGSGLSIGTTLSDCLLL